MRFKKMTYCQLISNRFSSTLQPALAKVRNSQIAFNRVEGNLRQNGGCLVVQKGGGERGENPLYYFKQEEMHDLLNNSDVLAAVGIPEEAEEDTLAELRSELLNT